MAYFPSIGLGSLFSSVAAAAKEWGAGKIKWLHDMQEAKYTALKVGKPMMVVVYDETCAACKHLGRSFAKNKDVTDLAESFVMVSTDYKNWPDETGFDKDDDYLPRILFYDTLGQPMRHLKNNDRRSHFYSYTTEGQVISSMKRAKFLYETNKKQNMQ